MASYDIGPRLGLEGENEFRKSLINLSEQIKTLGTDMAATTAEFSGNEKSQKALKAQSEILKKEVEAQREKVKMLSEAVAKSTEEYGENDTRTLKWKQALNNARTELAKTEGQLESNTEELKKNGDEAKDADGKWSGFGNTLKAAGTAIAAAAAAAAAAAVALTKSLVDGISATAEYGDNIDKMSQKLGLSAEAYQEWDFIAQHSGTSVDGLQSSMKKLAEAAVDGSDASVEAFNALGLTIEEARSMSQEDLFSAVITGLQGMEEGTERTAIAADLLGRSATELGPLLNTSAEATGAMRQQAHDLGAVMSNESVAASAAFQDSLQNLTTAFEGLKRGALSEFLPIITGIMDGLTLIFSGDADSGIGMIVNGVQDFASKVMEMLPKVMESGTRILLALSEAVISSIPILIPAAVDAVLTITQALIDNLPMILDAGVQAVIAIVKGIAEALPELIPAALDAILTIVDGLIDNIDEVIDAGIALVIGLAQGLINALPKLLEKAPVMIDKLVNAIVDNIDLLIDAGIDLIVALAGAIVDNLPLLLDSASAIVFKIVEGIADLLYKLVEKGKEIVDKVKAGFKDKVDSAKTWGKDLIDNFISGITEKWNALKQKVTDLASGIKNLLGFSEPKEGPLSNFHTYAPDMMMLYAKGIRDNAWRVKDQLAASFADVDSLMPGVADVRGGSSAGRGVVSLDGGTLAAIRGGSSMNPVVKIEFTGNLAQLGRILQPEIQTAAGYAGASLVM